jgi:hypothetical protein
MPPMRWRRSRRRCPPERRAMSTVASRLCARSQQRRAPGSRLRSHPHGRRRPGRRSRVHDTHRSVHIRHLAFAAWTLTHRTAVSISASSAPVRWRKRSAAPGNARGITSRSAADLPLELMRRLIARWRYDREQPDSAAIGRDVVLLAVAWDGSRIRSGRPGQPRTSWPVRR